MFYYLLTRYLSEHPTDRYFSSYGRGYGGPEWVARIAAENVNIGRAFEWAAFRNFLERTYSPTLSERARTFIHKWNEDGKEQAFQAYPEFFEPFEVKLSEQDLL